MSKINEQEYGRNLTTSLTDPDDNITRFEYDAAGREIKRSLGNGNEIVNEYNADGQLITKTNQKGSDIISSFQYLYNANGNVISQIEEDGAMTTYQYDALNRLVQVNYPKEKLMGMMQNFIYGEQNSTSQEPEAVVPDQETIIEGDNDGKNNGNGNNSNSNNSNGNGNTNGNSNNSKINNVDNDVINQDQNINYNGNSGNEIESIRLLGSNYMISSSANNLSAFPDSTTLSAKEDKSNNGMEIVQMKIAQTMEIAQTMRITVIALITKMLIVVMVMEIVIAMVMATMAIITMEIVETMETMVIMGTMATEITVTMERKTTIAIMVF